MVTKILEIEPIVEFFVGMIAYGGSAAAMGYAVFHFMGKKWIENKFQKDLTEHKHLQNVELQRLKIEIDSLLSAAIKLQDREFEILPVAWEKLDEAYWNVFSVVSQGQMYPNIDGMSGRNLEEFLEKTELLESQKDEIRGAVNRGKKYQDIIYWYRLRDAKSCLIALNRFVSRNGIFFPGELKEQFERISKILWAALVSHEIGHGPPRDLKMQKEGDDSVQKEAEPLYKAIASDIQTRLRSHGPK